jgi:hypothetical protein
MSYTRIPHFWAVLLNRLAQQIANGIDLDALLLSHLAYLTRYPFHLLPSEVSAQSWVLVFVGWADEKYTHDVLSGWLRALLNRPFASVQAVIAAPDVALPPSETIAQDTVAVINNLLNLSRGAVRFFSLAWLSKLTPFCRDANT